MYIRKTICIFIILICSMSIFSCADEINDTQLLDITNTTTISNNETIEIKESIEEGDSEANITSVVIRNDDKVYSIMKKIIGYTNGAHDNVGVKCENIDVISGKTITKEDIFTDLNKAKDAIEVILSTDTKYKDMLFDDWRDTLKDIFNGVYELNFSIRDYFVDIYFDPYFLGPWSSGIITVSLDALNSDFINKRYFNEQKK